MYCCSCCCWNKKHIKPITHLKNLKLILLCKLLKLLKLSKPFKLLKLLKLIKLYSSVIKYDNLTSLVENFHRAVQSISYSTNRVMHKKAGFLCGRRLREKATTDGEHHIAINRGRAVSELQVHAFISTYSIAAWQGIQAPASDMRGSFFFQGSSFGPTFVSFLPHYLDVETRAALKVT